MSQQYDGYLFEHISNVTKAINWLFDHGIVDSRDLWIESENRPLIAVSQAHDESKFSPEEYDAYDDHFYGKEDKDEDDIAVIDAAFDYAWLHHIHNNPHHWQYWVLVNDDNGKPKPLEMPKHYVIEMIADWMSFGFKTGNLMDIFDWYDSHSEKMILHQKTRKLVEKMLNKMESILKKEKKEEGTDDAQAPS